MSKKFYSCDPHELAEYIIRAFTHGDVEKAIEYMEKRKEGFLPGPYRDSWEAAIDVMRKEM